MSSKMQHGYLLLADISGYTSFLARTELDHAQEILSELLELLVKRMQPPLLLAKLEGDAVFMHAPESEIPNGDLLLDLIETTYVAFRDRLHNMQRSTTCQCAACKAMPALDLKFMAHFGNYVLQAVAGHTEVVGSDVNLAHRLLKNGVVEATGWRAYALLTEECLNKTTLNPADLHTQDEEFEHLGVVHTFSLDLRGRYAAIGAARRVQVEPAAADMVVRHDFAVPAPVLWDWVSSVEKRGLWMIGRTWTAGSRPDGRVGVGARNHCAHGSNLVLEEILDWRPFEYFTVRHVSQNGLPVDVTMTYRLEPIATGTRLLVYIKAKLPVPGFLNRAACNLAFRSVFDLSKMLRTLDSLLAEAPMSGAAGTAHV